jgi:dipeptidase D
LEGELYIGCAGGADVTACFRYTDEPVSAAVHALKISLTGLKGGHSGVDIHLGRANANQLLFRFLKDALQKYDIGLSSVAGGSLRNAIPREAFAVILIEYPAHIASLEALVADYEVLFNEEFRGIENPIRFQAERLSAEGLTSIPKEVQTQLTHAIAACPNNVINRFADMPDTVETSINMAIVRSSEGAIEVNFLARSSSESKKEAICSSIESLFTLAGADFVEVGNRYPGWNPNPQSAILAIMQQVFERQRGRKPNVQVMHAGLECGIILANVPGLDTVSFGPTIRYPHSPDEEVKIDTVQQFWDYLTAILQAV